MGIHLKSAWPLMATWIIGLGIVAMISIIYTFEADHFYGIAESREIVVNSEMPVEIKRVDVVEGQFIEKHQLLVELGSPELDLKINEISHQLEQLKVQKGLDKAELAAKVRQLRAEKRSKTTEIENRIKQLESRYRLNKALAEGLKSVEATVSTADQLMSPIRQQIDNLRLELADVARPLDIQIELLEAALNASESPKKIQVERLEKELEMLHRESERLNIYARISGLIGSINYKPGEKVAPFVPILTLQTQTPSFVKGYLLENVASAVKIGDKLMVASLSDAKHSISGTVVGVGARFVPYPVRLRKHPDLQIWGREVHVRISDKNPFILGEKVVLASNRPEQRWPQRWMAWVSSRLPQQEQASATMVTMPVPGQPPKPIVPLTVDGIEASGLVKDPDGDGYLVISDDTPFNRPLLFSMNKNGQITSEIPILGLDAMADMEGIAAGAKGALYLISSLSETKDGKRRSARNLLVRARKKGENCTLEHAVNLYDLLTTAARKTAGEAPWARIVRKGEQSHLMDVEGISWDGGNLLLAFKAPLENDAAVVLQIRDIDRILETGELPSSAISVRYRIRLPAPDNNGMERISDLYCSGDLLFLTSVRSEKGRKAGSVWQYDPLTKKGERLSTYDGFQPEGLTEGLTPDALTVVFDQGASRQSLMTHVKKKI